MKLLKLYSLFAGSMKDFAKPFKENETLYNQAMAFWGKLENFSIIIVVIFIVLGLSMAIWYYKPFNNSPGRHYTLKYWLLFLIATFIITFIVTLGFEYFAVSPKLDGALLLEAKIALGNACYATLLYFLTSFVWCNWLPTNAYRLFKI